MTAVLARHRGTHRRPSRLRRCLSRPSPRLPSQVPASDAVLLARALADALRVLDEHGLLVETSPAARA